MSKKIQLLAKIIKRDRDKSALLLNQARARLLKEQQKAQELNDYRRDYLHRIAQYEQTSATTDRLYSYRAFLVQLDQITLHQTRVVENLSQALSEKQQEFNYQFNRNKTFQDYLLRMDEQARRLKVSQQQRSEDSATVDRFSYQALVDKVARGVD